MTNAQRLEIAIDTMNRKLDDCLVAAESDDDVALTITCLALLDWIVLMGLDPNLVAANKGFAAQRTFLTMELERTINRSRPVVVYGRTKNRTGNNRD